MASRAYVVTYSTADGGTRTETVIGRNHRSVERRIGKKGGKILFLDRDESEVTPARSLKNVILSAVLFVLGAALVVACCWYRAR